MSLLACPGGMCFRSRSGFFVGSVRVRFGRPNLGVHTSVNSAAERFFFSHFSWHACACQPLYMQIITNVFRALRDFIDSLTTTRTQLDDSHGFSMGYA